MSSCPPELIFILPSHSKLASRCPAGDYIFPWLLSPCIWVWQCDKLLSRDWVAKGCVSLPGEVSENCWCLIHAFFPLLPLNEDNSKAQELWSLKVERTRSLNHYVEKTNSQPWNSSLVCFVEISSICVCFYQCEVLFVPAGSTNPNEPRLMRAKGTCVKTELRLWKLSLVLHARSVSFCIQCRKMNLSL